MKKIYSFYTSFVLCVLLFTSLDSFATSYTWNGNTNSNWYTSTNWTPNGYPTSSDNITISTGSHNLLLDSNKTVTNFTINADSLDIAAHTLTVSGSATFSAGTINSS